MTDINGLIVDTFGTNDNFLGKMSGGMLDFIIDIVAIVGSLFNREFAKLMNLKPIVDFIYDSGIINNFLNYLDENKDLIFLQTGKLEKHGVQLGKCGNLSAGIKIDRENNISKVKLDKPLILYEGKIYKFFNSNQEYNFNTINCIIELSKYKELYLLINENIKDEFVKKILLSNIKDFSFTSDEIYNQYLEFLEKSKAPTRSKEMTPSFKKFFKEGWRVPDDINKWNYLADYVFPDVINSKLYYLDQDNKKHYFHDKMNFEKQNNEISINNVEKAEKDFEVFR